MVKKPTVLAMSSLVAMSIPTISGKVTTGDMRKDIIKSNAIDITKENVKNDIPTIHDSSPNNRKNNLAQDPDLIMVDLSQDGNSLKSKEKETYNSDSKPIRRNITETSLANGNTDKNVSSNAEIKNSSSPTISQNGISTEASNDLNISKVEVLLVKAKDMNFEKNSTLIPKTSEEILKQIKDYVESNDLVMTIVGYADSFGKPSYNERLSLKRAESIGEKLIAMGMSPDRIQDTLGRGEKNPLVSNDTPEGRMENRRVEFRLVKRGIEL